MQFYLHSYICWDKFLRVLTHLFTLRYTIIYEAAIQIYFFSFFSANIKARIKNKVIFKIYILGLLKNILTFIPRWLEGRVIVAQTFQNEGPREAQKYYI